MTVEQCRRSRLNVTLSRQGADRVQVGSSIILFRRVRGDRVDLTVMAPRDIPVRWSHGECVNRSHGVLPPDGEGA